MLCVCTGMLRTCTRPRMLCWRAASVLRAVCSWPCPIPCAAIVPPLQPRPRRRWQRRSACTMQRWSSRWRRQWRPRSDERGVRGAASQRHAPAACRPCRPTDSLTRAPWTQTRLNLYTLRFLPPALFHAPAMPRRCCLSCCSSAPFLPLYVPSQPSPRPLPARAMTCYTSTNRVGGAAAAGASWCWAASCRPPPPRAASCRLALLGLAAAGGALALLLLKAHVLVQLLWGREGRQQAGGRWASGGERKQRDAAAQRSRTRCHRVAELAACRDPSAHPLVVRLPQAVTNRVHHLQGKRAARHQQASRSAAQQPARSRSLLHHRRSVAPLRLTRSPTKAPTMMVAM